MTLSDRVLKQLPQRRMRAVDGMAVTAAVWEEAHEYHRRYQQLAALLAVGPGVVTGLEVVASDPPDRTVYITPGVAVDREGNLIVITETIAYDIGARAEGLYRLLLHYSESRPTVTGTDSDEPQFVKHEFELEARPISTPSDALELARFDLSGQGSAVTNPTNTTAPRNNDIDRRFRTTSGDKVVETAHVGVLYLGAHQEATHREGWQALARSINRGGALQVYIDEDVALAATLPPFTVLYLTAQQQFVLSSYELELIYSYWKNGGHLWIEPCHRAMGRGGAATSFQDMIATFGFALTPITRTDARLHQPYLFAAPPQGYSETTETLRVGERLLYSPFDYGCLWQGERESSTPSRDAIRAAHELGENLLAFIVKG